MPRNKSKTGNKNTRLDHFWHVVYGKRKLTFYVSIALIFGYGYGSDVAKRDNARDHAARDAACEFEAISSDTITEAQLHEVYGNSAI